MLQLKEITRIYKTEEFEQKALDSVSINFRKNEFVSILGQSGSGKTTLLNIIGGLDQYTSGDLVINDISTKRYKDRDWDVYRNHKIGFVFQSYNLIMHQSILSNVELGLTLAGISSSERKKKAKEALKNVGLEKHINKKPNQLSGGQMQRVAIARALVNNPDILLADEPTGALDSETSIQIMDLLKEIAKDKLVIMVTHNPELAEKYSTRIIKLKDGHIIGDTNPCADKECKLENKDSKNNVSKKTSMTLRTALSLSLNNLMTKKGRTILTSIAGSIGIVGIALILSLSNGVQKYIDSMQKEALSTEPILVEQNYYDLSAMFEGISPTDTQPNNELNKINTTDDISNSSYVNTQIQTHKNDLVNFKKYLDNNTEKIQKYATNIQYDYDLNLQIYSKDNSGKITKVSIDDKSPISSTTEEQQTEDIISVSENFVELINNKDLINKDYEVIKGVMPKEYNEVVLVVDKDSTIPLSIAYSLGLEDTDSLTEVMKKLSNGEQISLTNSSYSYDEIIGRIYKLVLPADYYIKENGKWIDKSKDEDYVKQLYNSGIELKIVGILKAKENQNMVKSGFVGYLSDLTEEVISTVNQREIIKEQLENKDINILTGEKFDEIKSSYENNLVTLGIATIDTPSAINIYPQNFESKEKIKEIIGEYNNGVDEKTQIKYSDTTEMLLSGVTTTVNMVSYVLIAFVAISLLVSGIMISIITYISVLERTKEIGILRAIGASKKDISRVFNAETIIEGLISGILGVGVTFILTVLINLISGLIFNIDSIASLPLVGSLILILLSAVLTVIAGAVPSNIASKKNPVESLRGVE